MSEYFKLAVLCQTMILGSMENERMFSALPFLKSKLRNKLDKNVDTCLIIYVTKYEVDDFPYERALSLWRSDRQRRGETIEQISLMNLRWSIMLWMIIMMIHLEKVVFRMSKMRTRAKM